jgi:hypothetical protein
VKPTEYEQSLRSVDIHTPRPHVGSFKRGNLVLEFFPYLDLDPKTSCFSCCLRLDDLDAFYDLCKGVGLPETKGQPRLHPAKLEAWGGRVGALVDPDGTLIRLIQN